MSIYAVVRNQSLSKNKLKRVKERLRLLEVNFKTLLRLVLAMSIELHENEVEDHSTYEYIDNILFKDGVKVSEDIVFRFY